MVTHPKEQHASTCKQKVKSNAEIVNAIAIFGGVVALGVVGLGGYVFIRKDAIIEDIKTKVTGAALGAVSGSLPDMVPDALPDFSGPALPLK